jgi:hypothetical protein
MVFMEHLVLWIIIHILIHIYAHVKPEKLSEKPFDQARTGAKTGVLRRTGASPGGVRLDKLGARRHPSAWLRAGGCRTPYLFLDKRSGCWAKRDV